MSLIERLPPRVLVVAALMGGLSFQLLLGTSYVAATLDPLGENDGVPIGLVNLDTGARGETFAAALRANVTTVRWVELDSREALVRALEEKSLYGGLLLPQDFTGALESVATDAPRTVRVEAFANPGASTSGNLVAQRVLDAALAALEDRAQQAGLDAAATPALGARVLTEAQAQWIARPLDVRREDVNAVPAGGASGLAPTYLAMACWIGGYLGSVALERYRERTRLDGLRRGLVLALVAPLQAAAALAVLLVVGLSVPDPARVWAVLTVGTWMAYAVVSLCVDLLGLPGVLPAFAILSIGLPASGAIYPVEMLPPFFQALHPYSPFTWLVEALRTGLYATQAADLEGHALRLVALALAASILSVVWMRFRPRQAPAGEADAAPADG